MMAGDIQQAMEIYFGEDQKRINHALAVLDFSKKLLEKETADAEIVFAAALLHDIGIHEAEKKYSSTAGHYQELEGPFIARDILLNLGYDNNFIEQVCAIVGKHHTLGGLDSPEFQIVYEADWLVNLGDDYIKVSKEKKQEIVDKNFKTTTGKMLAKNAYFL